MAECKFAILLLAAPYLASALTGLYGCPNETIVPARFQVEAQGSGNYTVASNGILYVGKSLTTSGIPLTGVISRACVSSVVFEDILGGTMLAAASAFPSDTHWGLCSRTFYNRSYLDNATAGYQVTGSTEITIDEFPPCVATKLPTNVFGSGTVVDRKLAYSCEIPNVVPVFLQQPLVNASIVVFYGNADLVDGLAGFTSTGFIAGLHSGLLSVEMCIQSVVEIAKNSSGLAGVDNLWQIIFADSTTCGWYARIGSNLTYTIKSACPTTLDLPDDVHTLYGYWAPNATVSLTSGSGSASTTCSAFVGVAVTILTLVLALM